MGPRSDNRGYVLLLDSADPALEASMGPRSDNRGYAPEEVSPCDAGCELQWVHGRITVVMTQTEIAVQIGRPVSFNGSTVG